jgi:hypothetical protein
LEIDIKQRGKEKMTITAINIDTKEKFDWMIREMLNLNSKEEK